MASETLEGSLLRFFFKNEETGFAAGLFLCDGKGSKVRVSGMIGPLREGQQTRLHGTFQNHPRFGRQFKVDHFDLDAPRGKGAIISYLSSGLIKGVGPSLAERIVETLGEEALDLIEENPSCLLDVPGIGEKKATGIHESLASQGNLREVMLFLGGHGLSTNLAQRILKAYGDRSISLLLANPYRLSEDLIGIGFKKADDVARKLGIEEQAPERLQAALLHCLKEAVYQEGHTCLPQSLLIERASKLIQKPGETLQPSLEALAESQRIVIQKYPGFPIQTDKEEPMVWPLTLFKAEIELSDLICERARRPSNPLLLDIPAKITSWESSGSFSLPPAQKQALRAALGHPISVVTGGPGVGKTTLIRALVEIAKEEDLQIALAAPTGRAAKRLAEATQHKASTIHRLLEFQPGTNRFLRNPRNPLEQDLIVVDESSMLDIHLGWSLLQALSPTSNLVLVGDVDQLPSVGPGRVLGDLIESGMVPVTRLSQIFRQARGSLIIENAHRILEGQMPRLPRAEEGKADFYFLEERNPEAALKLISDLVATRLPRAFGLDPLRDIQILSPMYRGPLGVNRINETLANRLRPNSPTIQLGSYSFREGDKVLVIRNDYDLELYNGDVGFIESLDVERKNLVVCFPEKSQIFDRDRLDMLVPAYAITVHRAQGSEYPAVICALDKGHFLMLNRGIFYTAITRAKRLLILVGSRWALERAIGTCDENGRHTGLGRFLAKKVLGDGIHPEKKLRNPKLDDS
jgi:exodeoxyribonuclease V alpha subunit